MRTRFLLLSTTLCGLLAPAQSVLTIEACKSQSFSEARDVLCAGAASYKGTSTELLAAIDIGASGKEIEVYATLLAQLGSLSASWSTSFADLVEVLHPHTAIPALRDRALSETLDNPAREQAIRTLGRIPHEQASKALREVIKSAPNPLQALAENALKAQAKLELQP